MDISAKDVCMKMKAPGKEILKMKVMDIIQQEVITLTDITGIK